MSFLRVHKNPETRFDIVFQRDPNRSEEEAIGGSEDLYVEIERASNVIKSMHSSETVKDDYFQRLVSLAQVGFVGDDPDPKLASDSLRILKEEILAIEGHIIKNRYMINLGIQALIYSALVWILWWILFLILGTRASSLLIYSVVWTGAMFGTWISFGARKFELKFEDLNSLEKDKMYSYVRLPYIGICSWALLLFLNSGLLKLEIGSAKSEELLKNTEAQLLIGFIAGLLESKLGINLYNKAEDLTNKL
ncbi:hypothetical protein [Sporosarcina sp. Marseille-Q4943]|uniref:hypothetical protein n=1 Tax=Sporosarcina sp. Marseille-Q4943 TaxID=2942204 RepID=UPI00208DA6BE|nr:hypothetical protein [Sporosarcina sp. Marseille-Q4943]